MMHQIEKHSELLNWVPLRRTHYSVYVSLDQSVFHIHSDTEFTAIDVEKDAIVN